MTAFKPGGRWRSYLELVRPPALFTAGADSLAGWAWVIGYLITTKTPALSVIELILVPLALVMISGAIYAAGMCTNDIFDATEDLRDRPFRPIPSGRVSLSSAWQLAVSLQGIAIGLGLMVMSYESSFPLSGLESCFLLAIIVTIIGTYLYNRLFKESVVAPLFMGFCRLGNFWIGASLSLLVYPELVQSDMTVLYTPLALSIGTFWYVSSLTGLSRYEVEGGSGARVFGYLLLLSSTHPLWWIGLDLIGHCYGLVFLLNLMVLGWLLQGLKPVLKADAIPQDIEKGVGIGIRGVALTNLILCVALEAWYLALLIALMTWAAGRVARWFYAT